MVIPVGRHVATLADFELTLLALDVWAGHFRAQYALQVSSQEAANELPAVLAGIEWHVADDLGNQYLAAGQGGGRRGADVLYFDTTLRPSIDSGVRTLHFRASISGAPEVSWTVPLPTSELKLTQEDE